jgi:hypothetical protein
MKIDNIVAGSGGEDMYRLGMDIAVSTTTFVTTVCYAKCERYNVQT